MRQTFLKTKGGSEMNAIKIANGSNELEFKTWQEVAFHFTGSKTPVSSKTATAIVQKNGWEVVSVQKLSSSKSATNHIEQLIKKFSIIDKEQIKSLKDERDMIASTITSSKDGAKIIEINKKILALSNPSIDRDTFQEQVMKLYDEHVLNDTTEEA